ncbi:MAG: F0F1 ATP synthase subunit A [Chloroherpetonaceae bacterium]
MEYFLRRLTTMRLPQGLVLKSLLLAAFFSVVPVAHAAPTNADVESVAQSEEKFDVLHHVTDGNTLEFEPFGEIHLPTIKIGGFDISITRHVVMMWVASLALLLLFISIGNTYKKMKPTEAPKGLANLIEVIVDFVRIDIVKANIGHGYERFLPYLLTVFFFILTCNLLGLIPYAATATSNISVTFTLAVFTFVIVQFTMLKEHGLGGWLAHLTGGTPWFLWIIMIPVEFLSMFIKPFALMVRLFANMTAGHVVIVTLIGLIFVFKSWLVAPAAVAITLAMYGLELFVAFMQAYIFTMLSSLFIGMAAAHEEH